MKQKKWYNRYIYTLLFLFLAAAIVAITGSCGGGGGGGDGGGGGNTGGGGGDGAPSGGGGGGPTSVSLPETGQTISFATGDDGDLERGIAWPSPRFTVDGTGLCITDNLTGLMWVRTPDSTLRTWQQALDYANNLTICGYSDWRLPNRKELRSLINYRQVTTAGWLNFPAQGFSNVQESYYWSSSTLAGGTTAAWTVYMELGDVNLYMKANDTIYVWPVRAGDGGAPADLPETGQTTCYDAAGAAIACASTGQDGDIKAGVGWPSPRFTVDGTGLCITDNLTGLMWVRAPDSTLRTWATALTYANGLSLCGYDDWRLPNVNELESLINAEQFNSATWLNTQGFSNVQGDYYWSSTTYIGNTFDAWTVSMYFGGVLPYKSKANDTIYVWPVRAGTP